MSSGQPQLCSQSTKLKAGSVSKPLQCVLEFEKDFQHAPSKLACNVPYWYSTWSWVTFLLGLSLLVCVPSALHCYRCSFAFLLLLLACSLTSSRSVSCCVLLGAWSVEPPGVCLVIGETFAWRAATVVILSCLYLATGRNSFAAFPGESTSK